MRISDWSSDVCSSDLDQPAIELRPPVANEAHAGAVPRGALEVDRLDRPAAFRASELLRQVAPFVGDEAVAIEIGVALAPDAIGGDHRQDRKSVGEGKVLYVRLDPGVSLTYKKNK